MSQDESKDPKSPPEPAPAADMARRDFLDTAIAGSAALLALTAAYPIVRFINAPQADDVSVSEVVAGRAADIPIASAVAFRFGTKPGLLVRDEFGKLRAFIAICTHSDCVVQFRDVDRHIWCACHNGHYDMTGRNIKGPPPRPLEQLRVELRGDEVVVSKGA